MATIATLSNSGSLVPFRPRNVPLGRAWRRIWLAPSVIVWLETKVFDAVSSLGNHRTPYEQFDDLMEMFCAGSSLQSPRNFRALRPTDQSIWELKTDDIRFFGFFAEKNEFVILFGDFADRVKDHNLYAGYRNETARIRASFNLQSYVTGISYDEVLSDANRP